MGLGAVCNTHYQGLSSLICYKQATVGPKGTKGTDKSSQVHESMALAQAGSSYTHTPNQPFPLGTSLE